MSDKIKPSEVSQVLLEQLKGLNNGNKFDEVGTVLEVSDGVARIYGLRNAERHNGYRHELGGGQRRLCASRFYRWYQGGHGGEAYEAYRVYQRERQYARSCHQSSWSGHRR